MRSVIPGGSPGRHLLDVVSLILTISTHLKTLSSVQVGKASPLRPTVETGRVTGPGLTQVTSLGQPASDNCTWGTYPELGKISVPLHMGRDGPWDPGSPPLPEQGLQLVPGRGYPQRPPVLGFSWRTQPEAVTKFSFSRIRLNYSYVLCSCSLPQLVLISTYIDSSFSFS